MSNHKLTWMFAALLALSASSLRSQIAVAVEDGSLSGSGAGLVAQLNDDTYFDFQATLVQVGDIDSAAELVPYDLVILGGSGNRDADWSAAMASALLAWVQGGGGAILTGWGNLEFSTLPAGAATDLETLFPTANSLADNEWGNSSSTIDFIAPHPVVAGIADFSLGALPDECCIELNDVAAESDDLVLATMPGASFMGDGIAVAVKAAVGSGCSAYLGPIYLGDPSVSGYPDVVAALRSGLPDQLVEQAAAWAAACGSGQSVVEVPTLQPGALAGLALLLAAAAVAVLRLRR